MSCWIKIIPKSKPNDDGRWRHIPADIPNVRGFDNQAAALSRHVPFDHFIAAISRKAPDAQEA